MSYPLFQRYQSIIPDWEAFCTYVDQPLPICVWANTLRIDAETLTALLQADNIPLQPLPWHPDAFVLPAESKPGKHWAYRAGLYHSQEAVSLLPVRLLAPQPHERVLDLCAAPGNKTVQSAVAMDNTGTVVGNDLRAGRMRAMRHSIERLGLINISTTLTDGTNFPVPDVLFDKVIVDVPCSCEGTTRKSLNLLTRDTPLQRQTNLQQALLRKAVQCCRVGGKIIYSTCTYAPEENEMVIDTVLREIGTDKLRLLPARLTGLQGSEGLTAWQTADFLPDLQQCLRVYPHQHNTGGFFVALLEKIAHTNVHSTGHNPLQALTPNPATQKWLDTFLNRFGIPAEVLKHYHFTQQEGGKLYVRHLDHRIAGEPTADASGLMLVKTNLSFPKLSTAGAMLLGRYATRNHIALTAEQSHDYVHRRAIIVSDQQSHHCSDTGYVILHYQGYPLGIGLYVPAARRVDSWYPKGWALSREK